METLHKIPEETKEQIIAEIKEFLQRCTEVEAAYLLGSFLAEGGFRDVDVCLLIKEQTHHHRLPLRFSWQLEKAVSHKGIEFDVKILSETPIYFQYEVIKRGKLIFSRNPQKLADYEADVISRHLDYKPTLDFFNRKLLEDV